MAAQFTDSLSCGVSIEGIGKRSIGNVLENFRLKTSAKRRPWHSIRTTYKRRLPFDNFVRGCGLVSDQLISDVQLQDDNNASDNGSSILSKKTFEINGVPLDNQPQPPSVKTELIMLSLPAIAGQAIEPLAQLMETAYIGRLGVLELASAGVSMSIFNIMSKVFNIPLLSVATSFVAEDIAANAINRSISGNKNVNEICNDSPHDPTERKLLPSVSTALVLATGIGMVEALAMYFGSGLLLNIVGVSTASPMYIPAQKFLSLRAIGAPAVVVSLAIQGVLRGFKDTRTPVLCLGLGNLVAVFLFPILIYTFRLGVIGAAMSTVISQYIVTILMIWSLNNKTMLSIPNIRDLRFGGYLKSGGFLLGRTLAAVMTITLSTSMAARIGPIATAAHQICLQVWLSVSLLADAQGAAGQALVASFLAKGDYNTVKEITYFALKTGLFTGAMLAIILGASFGCLATLFTKDPEVLSIVKSGLLKKTKSLSSMLGRETNGLEWLLRIMQGIGLQEIIPRDKHVGKAGHL